MAREFGPKGVHVAHAIIDGVIDIPRTKSYNVNGGVEDSKISADAVSSSFHFHLFFCFLERQKEIRSGGLELREVLWETDEVLHACLC